ncbi:uncharacterized protein BXZ73DRAFT_39981 [Epithele typhae]|uniref:uncharacterized protein n=1 Tax=Epithele typhae TaxID=378194 RepID=UPI002007FCA7|nr:uncharacterized protein BXZ73DRAFT_39981 [Epithele typhae]KAH9943986.1 hypothetical protein BXZ73DRAFT_39981 [Epithele typhae]
MSSSLLAPVKQKLPLRVAQASVRYARRETEGGPNRQLETIRRALYPSNIRSRATPTGKYRPDVGFRLQRAIPSAQAHETIERAWLLHQRHLRHKRTAEANRKFESMCSAMETLRVVAPELYKEANKVDDPRTRTQEEQDAMKKMKTQEKRAFESRPRGLFPRELRVPTDTPPTAGWTYEFTPTARPSS